MMKKTSKRKLFYPTVEQSENRDDDERNEIKSTAITKIEEDVSTTPKHRVQLTERQQMSILLQLTANAQSSHHSAGLSPRTTRPPLKAVKGQRRAVKRGRLLHKRNERGETLLHLAAIRGDAKQVQRLLRLGANVNCPDFAGWTPLHEACNHGWFRVGELLLKAGANVDARGFDDFTPLHDAAVNSHRDLVELLLQHGAFRSPTNVNGKTPLNLTTCPIIADVLRKPVVATVEFCAAAARDDAGGACSRKDEEQLTSPSVSTACAIPNNMRKSSPQHQTPKGPDKPSSPRLTLRFQPIKSRDERHGAAATAASGGVGGSGGGGGGGGGSGASGCGLSSKTSEVTSSEPRYQSYCVTMETAEEDDVYEFKKDPNEECVPPPMSSSSVTHHRPSSSASSTSSVTTAASAAVASSDDHVDQQFNVVSSTKDATLRIQQTNIDSAPNNNNNSSSNNRAKMNENHVIRAASGSGAGDLKQQHKVDSHDAEATVKVVIKNNAENTNHSRSTGAASTDHHEAGTEGSVGEHDEGKRKRKRDAKDESTANKNGGSGAVAAGGGGMSLRNHGRDKSSPEERKSPENSAAAATASVENNAATKLHASGSETESTQSDAENEAPDGAPTSSAASVNNQEQHAQQSAGLPKVPPLKIVIPPTSMAEQDRDRSRVASRHSLPYIVNSSEDSKGGGGGNEGNGGNGATITTTASSSQSQQSQPTAPPPASSESKENALPNHPVQATTTTTTTKEDAKSRDGAGVHSEERWHRVTRSSQRMAAMAGGVGGGGGSAAAAATAGGTTTVSLTASLQNLQDYVTGECGSKANKCDEGAGSAEEHNGTEMPPRKRKLRPRGNDNGQNMDGNSASSASSSSSSSVSSHYEEQSMYLNCYEMFLNLRRQIDRRHTSMFVVQPKPPQGFKDYLMNKCSYVLAGNAASRLSVPMIPPPQSLNGLMKELYVAQEKARYSLRLQHIIEREKLTLSFEQETLRVHGRAARAMANQSVPLSVCTILKDEEVYNQIEPEQEEKERNARTRFNGRLFLSWLQDVDDKWDKVKKAMLLRHHNEAESLHAAQKLDWEWKLKELGICDTKSTPAIDVIHVPIVHVSDEFDLLPT